MLPEALNLCMLQTETLKQLSQARIALAVHVNQRHPEPTPIHNWREETGLGLSYEE